MLPHGAAVILHGPEAKATFTLTPASTSLSERAVSLEGNLLAGTYASKLLKPGEAFYLPTSGTNFYRVTTNRTQEAFSCWLPCNLKRNLTIETTTPIRLIQGVTLQPYVDKYNLSGQRVGEGYHGVVISNGKKNFAK